MLLNVLTPHRNVFSGGVKLVKLPGTDGSFELLKSHAPMISTLTAGELKIETETGEVLRYRISSGVAEVKNDVVTVLAESIE